MTERQKQRLRYSLAKVQYRALRGEIFALIEAGYCISEIHRMLRENGKLNMEYRTLCRYIYADQKSASKTASTASKTNTARPGAADSVQKPAETKAAANTPAIKKPASEQPVKQPKIVKVDDDSDFGKTDDDITRLME